MLRFIRLVLIALGLLTGFWGAIRDDDLIMLIGAFVFVLGLMLTMIISSFKK